MDVVTFTITLAAVVVKDKGNNNFAGISGTSYQFNTDSTPPTLASSSPSHGSIAAIGTNVVLTFSEVVQSGSGNIVFTPSSGSSVQIDIAGSQVSFSDEVITVNPSADFVDGVTFTVTLAGGVLKDKGDNDDAGVSGTSYQFSTDSTPPTLVSSSPSHSSITAIGTNVVLTFSEIVQSGSGNIVFTPPSGSPVSIDITDNQVITMLGM